MRTLLLSPVAALDPPCGDTVYTDMLLRHPPPGIEYETYDAALDAGRLRERGRRADLARSRGWDRLLALARVGRERAINTGRHSGLLFREPFRHFEIEPGAYDLVHCHVFSASFHAAVPPLVVSNAAVIEDLYTGARGWSPRHTTLASRADVALARAQRVQHSSHRMPRADAVVAFTETLRREIVRRGTPEGQTFVAPCFVESPSAPRPAATPRHIGFVATDFEAKGGPTVIEAFAEVRRERPDARLTVIGCEPRLSDDEQQRRGITWIGRVPRAELLARHLPSFDVFAYPTLADGLPLTVLEVMALGVPVATSDFGAMPEIVGDAGRVCRQGDSAGHARDLLALLDPAAHAEASGLTLARFESAYSVEAATAALGMAYGAAVARHAVR